MRRLMHLALLLLVATPGQAQVLVGSRVQVGTCTIRSGSGAPSSSLGAVCDTYYRTDSPYTVHVKTGASQWIEAHPAAGTTGDLVYGATGTTIGRLPAVATGQVLVSAGTGTAPAYSATPSVTTLTVTGVGTPLGINIASTNPVLRWWDNDAALDNGAWTIRADAEALLFRANNDAFSAATNWMRIERTGIDVDSISLTPSTGDIILDPGGNDIFPGTGYTDNLGSLSRKYLTLHAAELWVETLVAQNTIATIGGRVLVGPTTVLVADFGNAATTINVKHNQMASGDRVYLEADGKVEFIAVTSAASGSAGNYTYLVARNLDGTGANDWYAGDAVFNTGTTGDGYIDLYSVSGVNAGSTVGPTIVGNVRTGATYSDLAPRWAIGNLNGLYGYGADTYGAGFGDFTNSYLTVDATNGIRMIGDLGTMFSMDTAGNATFAGRLTVGTGRNILSNTEFLRGRGAGDSYNGFWGGSAATGDLSAAYACAAACYQRASHGSGWSWLGADEDTASATMSIGADYAVANRPLGSNVGYFQIVTGTPANGTYGRIAGPVVPVDEDAPYEYSVYVALSGSWSVRARVLWYGVDGGDAGDQPDLISQVDGSTVCTAGTAGPDLGTWCRAGGIFTPPAGARLVQLAMIAVYDGGDATPITFFTRPFFAQAQTGQTSLTPWGPGGQTLITGDMLSSDLVVANTLRSSAVTDLATGTGFWLDATGTPTFRVGNPSGNQLKWDGTDLTLASANTTIDSTGVTIAPYTASDVFTTTNAYRFTVANGQLGMAGVSLSGNTRTLWINNTFTGTGTGNNAITLISDYAPTSGGTPAVASLLVEASSGAARVVAQGEVELASISGDGTGKVLCLKSDGYIGTCDATTIGTSTCTCG